MSSAYAPIEADIDVVTGDMAPPPPLYLTPTSSTTQGNATRQPVAASEMTWSQRLRESSHPVALLFYILFRIAPVVIYILGNFVLGFIVDKNRFILHFIVLILLITSDFWNLKNIAGRLLVGLRWWNETLPSSTKPGEYENVWVFESADPSRYINPIDSKVFWILLYAQPVMWLLLAVLALLKFQFLYLIVVAIALALSLTNGMAFTKCDKFGKANSLATGIMGRAANTVFSRLNPFA